MGRDMARGRTWLIGILLVALALRLVAAFAVQHKVGDQLCLITGDAEGYWELARRIVAGDEFSLYEPPRRIHRMPGFPALLAFSMALFGESVLAARCLLAVVGTAACGAVYLLGRRLFDEPIALLACAMTAISPVMAGFSVLLLSETLFALTLTLSVWLAANWLAPRVGSISSASRTSSVSRMGWAFGSGVCVAVATLVRPSWLLAGPLLAVFVMFFTKPRSKAVLEVAVMLTALFAVLLPWTIRNHSVSGHWVFTTLWSGPSLYDGLSPTATGESDMRFFDHDNLMATQSEWDVDQHYKQAAWRFAFDNPGRAVQLTAIKSWRYWKPTPSAAQFGGWGPALLVAGSFIPVIVLAAFGGWRRRRDVWTLILLVGPIVYFGAIHAVFVGSLRYRLPAEYPLCVLAAVGASDLWRRCLHQDKTLHS